MAIFLNCDCIYIQFDFLSFFLTCYPSYELVKAIKDFAGEYVAYSPDSKYLATTLYENVKVLDLETRTIKYTLMGHSDSVWFVTYSPDGKYLATASEDKTIKIWDVLTGQQLRTLSGHSNGVVSVGYSPDGRYLASGGADADILIWEAKP